MDDFEPIFFRIGLGTKNGVARKDGISALTTRNRL